ncbi:MBL fold metallo-hydrolase [Carboxylicivirga sediminis]|uniref:MBL fold metallo-hydrolase n=1 Tax=Carboxylicivirga sediminis TaxID=2006564 RepID=A0A941F394_9BACT|nr:MBL fold metallo-hydrolase [Carboxylicivirga sediminis]MBR8535986.1 MBL fold metallo-hydrolase [Carboxylicivirga sediminis]
MIHVDIIPINPWQENTYILSDETKECVIIDPGCLSAEERDAVARFIEQKGYQPVRLLQTHMHLDHVFGSKFIADKYNLKLEAHKDDEFWGEQTVEYAANFGMELDANPPAIGNYLNEGDKVTFGSSSLEVIHVPGHSPGGIVFYSKEDKIAIVGDVLFRESIGRADLPGGDFETLVSNIKNKLLVLDDEVKVYPGHGPASTIGHERTSNPFLT